MPIPVSEAKLAKYATSIVVCAQRMQGPEHVEYEAALQSLLLDEQLVWADHWPIDDEILQNADIMLADAKQLDALTVRLIKDRHPHLFVMAVVERRAKEALLDSLNITLDGYIRPQNGRHSIGLALKMVLRTVALKRLREQQR